MPKPLTKKLQKQLNTVIEAVLEEGYSCWGFLFQEDKDGGVALNIFNNRDDEPLPVFIVKTQNALIAIRGTIPEEFNLAAQEEAVADALAGQLDKMPVKKNIIN